ncbi:hypothetical protein CAY60_004720 [Shouchella clausii]|jgi:hypothetical protein|uniref:Uncharacterized protein n=1 Tax=Shouchella clausii TaxID=79880 RepID=A0A268NYQ0_SHOCL|nr:MULTISPECIES: hypothetical protein [Shouchella]PAD44317.1 hypothetical protein CHH54_02615 [Bacillus sp. 7520-S]KKI86907.1 hypothetical protein WZ76_08250 [Shouchella clausii]MBU3230410.1 hypothetical protein [Shouchella clausii]MBU3262391.1 hypothetical protein [Shouchella clausii]MBU3507294.1 hypothetical protein [Shouchella clausii]
MRLRRILLGALAVISVGTLLVWYWSHQEQEKAQLKNEERELGKYVRAADTLFMEIDYRGYEQSGNVEDIKLTPTRETEHTMERWKAVSEAFPSIKFPEEEVEEEDWVEVYQKLIESEGEMGEVIRALSANLPEGEDIMRERLYLYVRDGAIREDNFEKLLKEKGIIE